MFVVCMIPFFLQRFTYHQRGGIWIGELIAQNKPGYRDEGTSGRIGVVAFSVVGARRGEVHASLDVERCDVPRSNSIHGYNLDGRRLHLHWFPSALSIRPSSVETTYPSMKLPMKGAPVFVIRFQDSGKSLLPT